MTRGAAILIFTSDATLRAAMAEQAALFLPAILAWPQEGEDIAQAVAGSGAGLVILDDAPPEATPERVLRLAETPHFPRLLLLTGPKGAPITLSHLPGLAKPFRMRDLAKLATQLLSADGATGPLMLGEAVLDPATRILTHRGTNRAAALTEKEFSILLMLGKSPGEAVSRDRMLRDIWGYADQVSTHTLETHLYRLRSKLKKVAGDSLRIRAVDDGYSIEKE